jgi:hypothetical protein
MAADPRERVHRTRPTGQLARRPRSDLPAPQPVDRHDHFDFGHVSVISSPVCHNSNDWNVSEVVSPGWLTADGVGQLDPPAGDPAVLVHM